MKILDTLVNKNDMFRTVLRHTQVYSKYLSAALHPDYLVNSEKRLELFQRLMSNCKNEHEYLRVNDEIATLMIDDVPYYMFDYYSKDLYSGNGLVSRNYFAHSAREICVERMKRLEEFKIANVDLIQKSLFTAYIDDSEAENYIVYKYCRKSSNREECIKFANRIADSIFCLDDQQGAIFFINGLYNNKVTLETINLNIYEGGGIIYYLVAISKVYGMEKYFQVADKLLVTATELLKYRSREPKFEFTLSAFSGYGSLIYLNYLLYYLTNKMCYKKNADETITYILEKEQWAKAEQSSKFDYLGGIAGVIVFMAHILLKEENAQVRYICIKMSKLLDNYILNNDVNQIGLAHGLSGFAYAFTMLYRITNNEYYLETAKQLLVKEDVLYENKGAKKVSWCKGETGMCIARLRYLELCPCQELLDKFLIYYNILTSKGLTQVKNTCLCHGIYGNIEVIRKIGQSSVLNDGVKSKCLNLEDYERSLFEKQDDLYLGFSNGFKTDIFMTGLSGIFYSILREEEKALPSILFLEV